MRESREDERVRRVELVCPAGSLPALRAAVDAGADCVYIGFRDGTNARNFPGLNFDEAEARRGVAYAHRQGAKVLVALNVYPQASGFAGACAAVDRAVECGADALIAADVGVLDYAHRTHPGLRLHLSVQASATNRHAIEFFRERFGVRRVVLPRVLSLAQVRAVAAAVQVEVEAFAFGSLCVMVEGRCALSSYVTGESPNTRGVCSPAKAVRWEELPDGQRCSRLNGVLTDRYRPGEPAGYPTLCKGRYEVNGEVFHAIEEPTSLNVLDVLPELLHGGVAALKVEGRQRSPSYVARVTGILREAIDSCLAQPQGWVPRVAWMRGLDALSEGRSHTLGALHRPWH